MTRPMLEKLREVEKNMRFRSKATILSNQITIKGQRVRVYTSPNRQAEMDVIYGGRGKGSRIQTKLPEESGFEQGFPYEVSVEYLSATTDRDVAEIRKLLPDGTLFRNIGELEVVLVANQEQQESLGISERDPRLELIHFSANPYIPTFRDKVAFPYEAGSKVFAAILGIDVEQVDQNVELAGIEIISRHLGSSLKCRTREDEVRLLYGVKNVPTG